MEGDFLPKPRVEISNPMEMTLFWPLVSRLRFCQYPMNHAAGMDANDEPREYGSNFIPASKGVEPLAA